MKSDNYIPRLLGVVFLIVAVASIVSALLSMATIGSGSISDNLVNISNNTMQVRISLLIDLITSVGIVVLAILLYTVLQNQNKNIAFVALGLYIAEAIILAISKISMFSLIPLSLEYTKAGSMDLSYFQTLGMILKDAGRVGWTIHMLFFSLGAILFYYLFYKAESIPRVLAIWGLVAASLALIWTLLSFFDLDLGMILLPPEMLFELGIGLWLIIKGFSPAKNQRV